MCMYTQCVYIYIYIYTSISTLLTCNKSYHIVNDRRRRALKVSRERPPDLPARIGTYGNLSLSLSIHICMYIYIYILYMCMTCNYIYI